MSEQHIQPDRETSNHIERVWGILMHRQIKRSTRRTERDRDVEQRNKRVKNMSTKHCFSITTHAQIQYTDTFKNNEETQYQFKP